MADDRAGGKHGWFTSTADNHSKHEVCAQDKTVIAAALAGMFKPASPSWDQIPCDIMHQAPPAGNCAQNVEPGLPPGYEPKIPSDPEPQTEPGYVLLGYGACRDDHQQFPPWGPSGGTNKQCAAKCSADKSCVGYMSTQNEEAGDGGACQYYCDSITSTLCPHKGTAGVDDQLTTTDGSQSGSRLRYCWLKHTHAVKKPPWRKGPWL